MKNMFPNFRSIATAHLCILSQICNEKPLQVRGARSRLPLKCSLRLH
uniref:Uncharacterized protein n=1 Tax=Anguilla anguilla TaxID=7936 RepID=A0A0E9Q0E2_ANGAN